MKNNKKKKNHPKQQLKATVRTGCSGGWNIYKTFIFMLKCDKSHAENNFFIRSDRLSFSVVRRRCCVSLRSCSGSGSGCGPVSGVAAAHSSQRDADSAFSAERCRQCHWNIMKTHQKDKNNYGCRQRFLEMWNSHDSSDNISLPVVTDVTKKLQNQNKSSINDLINFCDEFGAWSVRRSKLQQHFYK